LKPGLLEFSLGGGRRSLTDACGVGEEMTKPELGPTGDVFDIVFIILFSDSG
jgi:hypothetical protein